ncbi:MAG TPA: hypothetical protein VJU78_07760 [Chitinophagaceae bacterium]|nr:hypothetical protein [Chitinophagaceae bacterium]
MRTAALTLLSFVAFGYAAKAQKFSLLPQVGFENSKTTIRYNNSSSFAPAGVVFSPQVSLQFAYKSKPAHGAFIGASSSRSTVPFSFTNPETGMENYKTITGKMQVRLEGGYQFSSKPIYFKKQGNTTAKQDENKITEKKSCGSYSYKSSCMKNKTEANRSSDPAKWKQAGINKGSWVRIQPSVGMGFIPSVKTDVITKMQNGQTTYEYRAGNWNTALVTGMGFEFGKNNTRLVTLSVNYFKGIGNLDKQIVSTVIGTKTLTTQLQSEVSGWNMRIGVPFTLGAKKPAIKQQPVKKAEQSRPKCGQYKIMYRCNRTI